MFHICRETAIAYSSLFTTLNCKDQRFYVLTIWRLYFCGYARNYPWKPGKKRIWLAYLWVCWTICFTVWLIRSVQIISFPKTTCYDTSHVNSCFITPKLCQTSEPIQKGRSSNPVEELEWKEQWFLTNVFVHYRHCLSYCRYLCKVVQKKQKHGRRSPALAEYSNIQDDFVVVNDVDVDDDEKINNAKNDVVRISDIELD